MRVHGCGCGAMVTVRVCTVHKQERAVVQALNALRRVERYDNAHGVVARPVDATSHEVVGAIDELRTTQLRFQGVLPPTLNLRIVVVAARLSVLYLPSTELQSLEDGVTAAGSSCSASSRADEMLEWQGDTALARGNSRSARDSYAAALQHMFDGKVRVQYLLATCRVGAVGFTTVLANTGPTQCDRRMAHRVQARRFHARMPCRGRPTMRSRD